MRRAFSLVELSIVLVILGLLTGGILAGKSLIRAAEIRSISNDFQRYKTALYGFKDKYFGLPGDITNATSFWGTAGGTGTGSACFSVVSTTSATCNGNGDNWIRNPTGSVSSDIWRWGERFRSWQHLANAGLIEGNYTGATDGVVNNYAPVAGTNVPAGKLANSYFDVVGYNATTTPPNYFPNGVFSSATRISFLPIPGGSPPLTPGEAWNIDQKMDNGRPGGGLLQTHISTSTEYPGCSTTDSSDTAEYALSTEEKKCILVLKVM